MAITGRTGTGTSATEAEAAAEAAAESKAVLDAIVSLRKRLAMVQELQVDNGDIDTDDHILNAERTS
jgi:hypothetical protein